MSLRCIFTFTSYWIVSKPWNSSILSSNIKYITIYLCGLHHSWLTSWVPAPPPSGWPPMLWSLFLKYLTARVSASSVEPIHVRACCGVVCDDKWSHASPVTFWWNNCPASMALHWSSKIIVFSLRETENEDYISLLALMSEFDRGLLTIACLAIWTELSAIFL